MRRAWAALAVLGLVGACVGDPPIVGDGGTSTECSDPTFCDDKCGSGLADKCGLARDCSDCGPGRTCDGVTHKCTCTELPNLCANRCGMVPTNCGTMKDCGGCDGGACPATGNCSNCTPDNAAACAGRQCGTATNNCGQQVLCGPNGGQCAGGAKCGPTGVCCPLQSAVCGAGVCGKITASCGELFDCGGCGPTKVCSTNACVCNCDNLLLGAPICEGNGCACMGHNQNTDPNNCGCPNVKCPLNWQCKTGVCIPP